MLSRKASLNSPSRSFHKRPRNTSRVQGHVLRAESLAMNDTPSPWGWLTTPNPLRLWGTNVLVWTTMAKHHGFLQEPAPLHGFSPISSPRHSQSSRRSSAFHGGNAASQGRRHALALRYSCPCTVPSHREAGLAWVATRGPRKPCSLPSEARSRTASCVAGNKAEAASAAPAGSPSAPGLSFSPRWRVVICCQGPSVWKTWLYTCVT